MPSPLRINLDGGVFVGLKEMSNTEIDQCISRVVTEKFASTNGLGWINVNVGGDFIGSFTDTYETLDPGGHPEPAGVLSDTYNFYQNISPLVSNINPELVSFEDDGVEIKLFSLDSDQLYANVVNRVAEYLVANNAGVFALSQAAPGTGTWASQATILNKNSTNQVGDETTLWIRTDSPTANQDSQALIVSENDVSNSSLKQTSNTDIEVLETYLRNYIAENSNKIGHYVVNNAAPGIGTWIQQGEEFTDTRYDVVNVNYAAPYTAFYSGFNGGSFTGFYDGATVQSSISSISTIRLWLRIG